MYERTARLYPWLYESTAGLYLRLYESTVRLSPRLYESTAGLYLRLYERMARLYPWLYERTVGLYLRLYSIPTNVSIFTGPCTWPYSILGLICSCIGCYFKPYSMYRNIFMSVWHCHMHTESNNVCYNSLCIE